MTRESIGAIQVAKVTVGPYGENCYVLTDPETKESVLVDPGDEIEKIIAAVGETKVVGIVITHRHFDHTGALQQARTATKAPVGAHPLDAPEVPGGAELALAEGYVMHCGRQDLRIIHTPGHTPGSIAILNGKTLIAGDTVFPGGPGKTASASAFEELVNTIKEKIYTLPDDTVIYPGHGENTTVGESKKEYAVFAGKTRKETPFGDVLWLSS